MVHAIPKSGIARTYLIEEDEGLMAVDVGGIGAARDIETYCTGIVKRPLRDIRFIFTTHFHIDHIGGIGTLLRRCSPETQVLFHLRAKGYIEGQEGLAPMQNWLSGLVPTIRENYCRIGDLPHIAFESFAGVPLPIFSNYGRFPTRTGYPISTRRAPCAPDRVFRLGGNCHTWPHAGFRFSLQQKSTGTHLWRSHLGQA